MSYSDRIQDISVKLISILGRQPPANLPTAHELVWAHEQTWKGAGTGRSESHLRGEVGHLGSNINAAARDGRCRSSFVSKQSDAEARCHVRSQLAKCSTGRKATTQKSRSNKKSPGLIEPKGGHSGVRLSVPYLSSVRKIVPFAAYACRIPSAAGVPDPRTPAANI
ncbi:hypothetical protein DL93DRAFT_2071164 [Clavulina sp. PMI_390]|nr:hypothetical protein DL93DRAFT_2071164 [Clavulina sp. PMI_390]